jgi:transposase
VIAPLLPNKPRGVPRVDDRRVLNGIFWVSTPERRCIGGPE